MNILFASSGPSHSESSAKRTATNAIRELRQGHPDAKANEIVAARRSLIAELEQRRRAAAAAA
jgi:hypothetical protein